MPLTRLGKIYRLTLVKVFSISENSTVPEKASPFITNKGALEAPIFSASLISSWI
ncbi:MAG: hypothetical protein F6K24_43955 [Okeania sp. SIO2D1]|nr:hypothetical protein [Okeania sp. SIO2D1]